MDYTSLPTPSTIRLIRVQPDKVNNEIACNISCHDFMLRNQEITYRALSYRWGDPKHTRKISLRETVRDDNVWHPYPIHENLWQFISHVWNNQMFDDYLWIDYLCLDQKNKDERSQQIPRMRMIYWEAEEVIIWLGLRADQGKNLQALFTWPGVLAQSKKQGNFPDELVDTANFVYYHEYWKRVWVVQEVGRAKVAVVAIPSCSLTIKFNLFERKLYVVSDKIETHPPIMDIWRLYNAPNKRYQIQDVLQDFSLRECTKPNDQLYGLLGIVAPHNDGTSPLDHIRIDYDRSLSDVILDTVFEMRIRTSLDAYSTILNALAGGRYGPDNTKRVIFTRDANNIEEYSNSNKTAKRHKELACTTLEVFDALNYIMCVPGAPARQNVLTYTIFSELMESLEKQRFKPSIHEHAVLVGIALVVGSTKGWIAVLGKDWMMRRKPRRESQSKISPWRCAAHRAPTGVHPLLTLDAKNLSVELYIKWYQAKKKYLKAQQEKEEDHWGKGRTVLNYDAQWEQACGYTGKDFEPCDGSRMSFEIPSLGFRLAIEKRNGDSSSSLHIQFGDRDLIMENQDHFCN